MKVATVTGGSRGLGREIAIALAQRGWAVITDGRDAAALEAARRAMGAGDDVVAIAGDVGDAAHRQRLVDAVSHRGRLDLLVNNASELGPSPLPALADLPEETLTRILAVNVVAPLALVRACLPWLRAAGDATVVNLSSDAAVEAYGGWGGYGASKAALDQASAVLAVEEQALRVYAFDPGDMRTNMHQRAFPGEDISDRPEASTVVPALLRLIEDRPRSGRYRAADLLAHEGDA